MPDLKINDTVTTTIEGRVVDKSDAHGLCYLVELPQKDFSEPRKIWIDAVELETDRIKAFLENFAEQCKTSVRLDAVQTAYFGNWARNLLKMPYIPLPSEDVIVSVKVDMKDIKKG